MEGGRGLGQLLLQGGAAAVLPAAPRAGARVAGLHVAGVRACGVRARTHFTPSHHTRYHPSPPLHACSP